jgi:hypothetical protein
LWECEVLSELLEQRLREFLLPPEGMRPRCLLGERLAPIRLIVGGPKARQPFGDLDASDGAPVREH